MSNYSFQADIKLFNPNATQYNGENALFLADCAKLAYHNKDKIKQAMLEQLNFTHFHFFSGKSTQAFIAGNDKFIIVAFRGTEGKVQDVLADAKLKPEAGPIGKNGPIGKLHRGFHDGLHEVWDDTSTDMNMRQFIKQILDNKQSIWFCGHSLGAALATIAAAEYIFEGNDTDGNEDAVKGIYTIGQPRVGNDEFAEAFDEILGEKCFRFVNNNDVVTRIPPPGIILDYTHVGQELYLDRKGKLQDSIPWWKKFWDRLNGVRKDIGKIGLDALADHGSQKYVELIKDNRSVTISKL